MKRTLLTFLIALIAPHLQSQVVESVVEFEINAITENDVIQLLDATEEHVLVLVRSNSFTMSTGFEFQDEESNGVLLFCDLSLNVLWYMSFEEIVLHDAIFGQDRIYLYGVGSGVLQTPGGLYDVEQSSFVGALDFSGQELWFNEYSALLRLWSPERSLAVDFEDNLILSSGLWNYEHPASNDTLFFLNDTCHCSAVSLDFALCATTLKWDAEGDELMYHVLDSHGYSYVNDVGCDSYGNFYVCGYLDHSMELPVFAGEAINGGEFVLKFGEDNQEQWFYNRSSQEPGYNSSTISFIDADELAVYLHVPHNTNEVVTEGDTVILDQPIENLSVFKTIHQLDIESGSLIEVNLFAHMGTFLPIQRSNTGYFYAFANLITGFVHEFPPFTFNPVNGALPLLVRDLQGNYLPIHVLYTYEVSTIDNALYDKLYLDMSNQEGNVVFGLDKELIETNTSDCIVIIDQLTATLDTDEPSELINVYPNPNEGLVNINAPFPMKEVLIYSTQGELLLEKGIGNLTSVQLEHSLAPGCYMVTVLGDDARATLRLLVRH